MPRKAAITAVRTAPADIGGDVGQQLATEIGRVKRRWHARLDARFKQFDLTQARWIILLFLRRFGPQSQRELAELVGVEGPTMVRLLDALEERGLIERREADGDRRIKQIHLTKSATPLIQQIAGISDALRAELLDGIPQRDLVTAHRVLATIADRLERNAT